MSVDQVNSVMGRVRLSARSDEQLLARARQGDTRCFDELHRRYRSSVFGYCLMRLADRQAAEDATQEVFLKVSQSSGAPIESAKAWLFTVARNITIDSVRRDRAIPAFTELASVLDSATHSQDETAFSALDVVPNVYIALRRLPTRERQAFIHREFHDWTSQRIADELKTRASNVDVLVCRARAAFGRAYAEVADLPFACRRVTETIYRELGSGASEHGLRLMKAHLMVCPRCHAEHQRAHSPRFVGAIVPWLWLGTQTHALAKIGERIKMSVVTAGTRLNRAILPSWPGPAKAAAALMIAAAATALVPSATQYLVSKPSVQSASARTPRPSVKSSSSGRNTAGSTRSSIYGWVYGGATGHDMAASHAVHEIVDSGHDTTHEAATASHDTHQDASGSTVTKHSSDGAGTGAVHMAEPAGETHTDGGATQHATEPHMGDGGDPTP